MTAPPAFHTPILLLVFNRPETTKAVFERVRSVRPAAYYVAADGPRLDRVAEAESCAAARQLATAVDWECSVNTLFRDGNLGAGPAVASAIGWFFDQVPQGIILEDDCIPNSSFFRFCEELLAYYKDTASVMHISGNNFQYGRKRGNASYYFSRYTHSWGWATWRRAWAHYDFDLIPEADRSHVWDVQWLLSVERAGGMAVLPNVNLVTNIGFGEGATHTHTVRRFAMLPAQEIQFPLIHPKRLTINRSADSLTYYANFRNIPDLRLFWFYRAWDFIGLVPERLHKAVRKLRRALGGRTA